METWISTLFGSFLSLLLLYKYAALFVIGYVAAVAIPLPASTTLVAAGAFASQGYLNIYGVLATAFFANISGDLTGYFLALHYGEKVFRMVGLRKVLVSARFKQLEEYMRNFPESVIFITRFLTEVSFIVSILCGISQVRYRTFLTFDLLGETAYVLLYGMTGYYLGGEWENNVGFLFKAAMTIISIGVTLNVLQWALYRKRGKSLRG